MNIKLFNTLTKQKEMFTPINADNVRMYVCGPTVYDLAHVGNARPILVFDCLFRLLTSHFPHVTYVRNITDVDDKINQAARENSTTIAEITKKTITAFHEDIDKLFALPPTFEPKATEHIQDMIEMISLLIESENAYIQDDHVLFDVETYDDYGTLSRKKREDLIAGSRVEIAHYKKNPGDFVLWKPSDADQPGWDSPWGFGRPGWHIECSAMSKKLLGDAFDIHGGGIDLMFPHHENEIAQSCCANKTKKMAHYWLHNGHVTLDGQKMSKSLGNVINIRDLLQDHHGEIIRYALLSAHYRQPIDINEKLLAQAKQNLDRLYNLLDMCEHDAFEQVDIQHTAFANALCDDLNTPLALTELHKAMNTFYREVNQSQQIIILKEIYSCGKMLGLFNEKPGAWFGRDKVSAPLKAQVLDILAKRQNARLIRDYEASDRYRDELKDLGVRVDDTPQGAIWRFS